MGFEEEGKMEDLGILLTDVNTSRNRKMDLISTRNRRSQGRIPAHSRRRRQDDPVANGWNFLVGGGVSGGHVRKKGRVEVEIIQGLTILPSCRSLQCWSVLPGCLGRQ